MPRSALKLAVMGSIFFGCAAASAQTLSESPDDILYRHAAGKGSWGEVEALAAAGDADAMVKWLGYSVWSEYRNGSATPSPMVQQALDRAAVTIKARDISAMLAVRHVLGGLPGSWDGDGLPRLKAQARSGDRAAISLACRLAALPSETMGTGVDACRAGIRMGMADAAYGLAVLYHARPDDFVAGFETRINPVLGVPRSRAKAVPLYRNAAAKGHPAAQARLAHLTAVGAVGVAKDEAKARHLAGRAAEQGNAEAKAVLALLLLQGRGGEADPDRARTLLDQSARAGNRMAQMTLAALHIRGQGVTRDFTTALTWMHLAALSEHGDPPQLEADPLLLEPLERTRMSARRIGNAAIDLDALIRAAHLRKDLADSGEWPLVDPVPPTYGN